MYIIKEYHLCVPVSRKVCISHISHIQIVPCSHETNLTPKQTETILQWWCVSICVGTFLCPFRNAYCNNQGRVSNLGLFQCYFIVISEHTNFSLCLRVREAAMTSLMEVTMLVASSAPEILSPDL